MAGALLLRGTALAQSKDETPEVVAPRQTHFVEARYPESARDRPVEATVVLRLNIDAKGNVTAASVERGAGPDFDRAAVQAAQKFKFEPARRQGEPIAATILYEYRFTLEPTAAPAAKATAPAPRASARAVVTLLSGDVPIAGASVELTAPDQELRTGRTDEHGQAQFADLPPGRYRVTVTAPGFAPYAHDETLKRGRETRVAYSLVPSDQIEVFVHGEVKRDVTVREITEEELKLVPGGAGDPIRVVESLPGVARTTDGTLIIRGASPFFSGVMLDGMAVPHLYHNYEITSVVPADMVDTVKLYPSNYGVRNGRYIGGLVEVGLRTPNTRCTLDYGRPGDHQGCYHGLLDLNLFEGRTQFEGPLPRTRRWSFALALRRSWIDVVLKKLMEESGLKIPKAPKYHDGYALLEYEHAGERLSLRAYGSRDALATLMEEEAAPDVASLGSFELEYGFERAQAVYTKDLGNGLGYASMLGVGRNHITTREPTLEVVQHSWPIAFRHELNMAVFDWLGVNVGFDLLTEPYELSISVSDLANLTPPQEWEVDSTNATFGAYVEAPVEPTRRLTVVPGLRADYTPLYEEATTSPRLVARYDLVERPDRDWFTRATVKAGAGLYHQAPPIALRTWDDDTNVKSVRARQFSLGLEQELNEHLDWSVEGFFIDRDRLISTTRQDDGQLGFGNEGRGHTVGIESFLRYHSSERFFGWIAYTLQQGLERSPDVDEAYPPDFDQTHNLILVGSLDIGRNWRAGARFRYVTGNPYTDIARPPRVPSLFDGHTGENVPQYTGVNAVRMEDVHQLDVRVDKRWDFRVWSLTTYLDVRNVYNHRIADTYFYNYDFTQREVLQQLPILPTLGVKGEF